MLIEIVTWACASLILLAIVIIAAVAIAEKPIHRRDHLDRILADVVRKKGNCL